MKKTVCELFAGVGGFRCGLNAISRIEDTEKPEKWKTVWFSQWEPADKKIQWAHGCYVHHFGICKDLNGNDTTNIDIHAVDKASVPNHNLLVGGFPCQDYSVASTLATSKGLEGKKGVLWWDIRDVLEAKETPFVLLENVDRLIKSPASQRGRDFAIILACFRDLGYTVEWRVINAAEYGYQQRRRRIFIFAYKSDTGYARRVAETVSYGRRKKEASRCVSMERLLLSEGFFAQGFPVVDDGANKMRIVDMSSQVGEISESFSFAFENSGVMKDGIIYTMKTAPDYHGRQIVLGDIIETGNVDEAFFIPEERLYYTAPEIDHSDETEERLSDKARHTWQYIKGAKRLLQKAKNGHIYNYAEGPIPMMDVYEKPVRTILTGEGSFSRSTHIVKDKKTGRIRLLTPIEIERSQGFPDDWTKESLVDGELVEMPVNKRRFMMGNALVVNLVRQMERQLSKIFEAE